jgi:hypothetical protein
LEDPLCVLRGSSQRSLRSREAEQPPEIAEDSPTAQRMLEYVYQGSINSQRSTIKNSSRIPLTLTQRQTVKPRLGTL